MRRHEGPVQGLRRRAEDVLLDHAGNPLPNGEELSLANMRHLVHELQVHQMELEMQNDELRQTQLQLDATRARYFDLYDLAPVGYCTVNADGVILEANLEAATQLGVTRSGLLQRPISQFILKSQRDDYYLFHHRLLDTGEPQSCELQMQRSGGATFWATLAASVAQDTGGAPVMRLMVRDISERKRADDVLRAKNVELDQARRVAEKSSRAKSDFLNSMSHELRSPLNTILGFAQLLDMANPPPSPTQKDSIDHIQQAGWYLLDLINEILELATVESGHVRISLESMDLHALLQECRTMFDLLAFEKGIHMQLSGFTHPVMVHADRLRLKQVLSNLFSNAIKYNRKGGAVEVTFQQLTSKRVRVNVKDSGVGLSADQLALLFQPFSRLEMEPNAADSTGIGLAICKRLMTLMGGAIGAESTVGVGSIFWIELNSEGSTQ